MRNKSVERDGQPNQSMLYFGDVCCKRVTVATYYG
jgi:hypothetical protein